MSVYFVYLNSVSRTHIYEWRIAPRAVSISSSWRCTSQRLYDFFIIWSYDRREWLVFMRSLLLHSQWARLSRSSGRISAHMTGQANLEAWPQRQTARATERAIKCTILPLTTVWKILFMGFIFIYTLYLLRAFYFDLFQTFIRVRCHVFGVFFLSKCLKKKE